MIQLPSIKSLFIEMRFNGTRLATGSGFVAISATGPLLITNRHNFTGRNNKTGEYLSNTGAIPNEICILQNREGHIGQWVMRIEPILRDDFTPLWIEHPNYGASADFVALPLTQLDEVALYPYSFGDDNPKISISPSDSISVVGFPFGLTGGGALAIWATGFIATEHDINFDNLPVLLVDCRARQGQSGSAVIAHRNSGMVSMEDGSAMVFSRPVTRLIGIYSGRINEQSDLGFVWKAGAIKELIDSIK